MSVTDTEAEYGGLRLMIGERILPGQTDADTFFTDSELRDIIAEAQGNYFSAAAMCWRNKAGYYAGLVDTDESGSVRKLSQLFKNANSMAQYYESLTKDVREAYTLPPARAAAIYRDVRANCPDGPGIVLVDSQNTWRFVPQYG